MGSKRERFRRDGGRELLERMAKAFERRNARALRKINDIFINHFMQEEDGWHFRLAILSYILSKVASKPRYFRDRVKVKALEEALYELARGGSIEKVERALMALEEEDPRFIFDLFTKAKVKMAAILYAKGMSLGKASKLTGIPKAEILSYAGKTMMFDRLKSEVDVKDRVKRLERYLGG